MSHHHDTSTTVPHFVINDLTTGERHIIQLTPREGLTIAEVLAHLADRRAAAHLIDPENCEIFVDIVEGVDAYGLFAVPDEWSCIGSELFVRNAPDDPWVWDDDLPDDKAKVLHARLRRERARDEREYLAYLHAMDES